MSLGTNQGETCRRTLPPKYLGEGESGACFDTDERFRYTLWRRWPVEPPKSLFAMRAAYDGLVAFVGLNPSTADESQNDPTVTRCINFAKDWGFSGMVMLNLFAYRATDPKEMKAVPRPLGVRNMAAIMNVAAIVNQVVACWGVHGEHQDRGDTVAELLLRRFPGKVVHLGLTKDGHPRHPLYLASDTKRTVWSGKA